ncbi:MAG: c-type cytochrome [Candidatus Binatia bacterium]
MMAMLEVWRIGKCQRRAWFWSIAIGGLLVASPSLPEQQEDLAKTLARGAKVYATLCQPCHGDRYGKGRIGSADPHNEKGHTWHHPDAQLKDWTLNGKPGFHQDMPAFKESLEEQDVEAILDFIKTWWTTEQREMQADISRRYDQSIDKKNKGRAPVK